LKLLIEKGALSGILKSGSYNPSPRAGKPWNKKSRLLRTSSFTSNGARFKFYFYFKANSARNKNPDPFNAVTFTALSAQPHLAITINGAFCN